MITSTSNGQIKKIQQLLKKSRTRKEEGLFVAEGIKMFREAPPERIEKIYLGASFAVLEAAAGATLYIDCEHAQVWRVEADGTEVNMMGVTTGELPELRPGATGLQVGGSGLQVTVRALLIERG